MATVLVVDDDAHIVDLLTEIVSDTGHTPISATNGYDALMLAQSQRPNLIISDIMMPIMDGYELLAAIRSTPTLSDIDFVLISAGFAYNTVLSNMATAFVPKPLDISVIEGFLQNLP